MTEGNSGLGSGLRRRTFLAAAAMMAAVAAGGPALADAKVIRMSTPGSENEIQSKGLVVFKEELEKAMPGAFDVQIHYNGTLFAQGTEIERCSAATSRSG